MLKRSLKWIWYWVARWGCRVFCILWFGIRAYGKENVPEKGGFLLVSNHQSYLDPILCGVALRRRLYFLARDSLLANRLFALLLTSLNTIPVKPGKADVSAMKKVISQLKAGWGVCLYPEGTRTYDGRIELFKPGFGLLCRRGEATVVPMVIDGAFECWPRHRKMFSRGPITIYYGKAITLEQVKKMGDEKLAEAVTETLRRMQTDSRVKQGKVAYTY